jgi:putative acetyltransferase
VTRSQAEPPSGFSVRPVSNDDAKGVIALYAACWGEYDDMVLDTDDEMEHLHHVSSHYESLGGSAWVAEHAEPERAGKELAGTELIAGSVAWRPLDSERAELQMVYVIPDSRKLGLASFLVDMVTDHVTELGFSVFELWSDTRFNDAHRLYRAIGWNQLEETRVLGDLSASTEIHFVRDLDPGN